MDLDDEMDQMKLRELWIELTKSVYTDIDDIIPISLLKLLEYDNFEDNIHHH